MSKFLRLVITFLIPLILLGLSILGADYYLKNFPEPCVSAGFRPCFNGAGEYFSIIIGGGVLSLITLVILFMKLMLKR